MNDPERTPDVIDSAVDARIDAAARSAGREFRRPAPTDGIDRAHRARRQKQAVRAAGTAVVAVAVVAVGAILLNGRQGGDTIAPATIAESTVPAATVPASTVPSSTAPNTTPDSIAPETAVAPDETVPTSAPLAAPVSVPPNATGAPAAVYTAETFAFDSSTTQTVVDPTTGAVLSSGPADALASRDAQDALLGRTWLDGRDDGSGLPGVTTYRYELGGVTLSTEALPSEIPDLESQDQTALPRFDRCGQSELIVSGASDTALPARVHEIVVSADRRWLVTRSSECPEGGTLLDGYTELTSSVDVQLFSVSDLAAPASDLSSAVVSPATVSEVTFSPDGNFVALGTFGGERAGFRFFDTASGSEVDVQVGECDAFGTRYSRFIGPWIGDSSIALQLHCADTKTLLVRDLATQEELRVDLPVVSDTTSFVADVDYAHFDRPSNVWFTLCDQLAPACWLGQGGGELVELPGIVEASFLPLGFSYGG
jgi:hypothetical protein